MKEKIKCLEAQVKLEGKTGDEITIQLLNEKKQRSEVENNLLKAMSNLEDIKIKLENYNIVFKDKEKNIKD